MFTLLRTFQMCILLYSLLFILSTAVAQTPAVMLNTGIRMPVIGYGTWQASGEELEKGLNEALEVGYRHIDTAYVYKNEKVIGKVLKEWFSSGKLKREDIFVTTKLPLFGNKPELVPKYIKESLENLQLDYVDMYLIHSPVGFPEGGGHDSEGNVLLDMSTDHIALWKAMEEQFDGGKAKAIGLSNFNQSQIERVRAAARVPPSNLQIELQAYLQQIPLVQYCKQNNISITSYATLGSKGTFKAFLKGKKEPDLLENAVVTDIAKKHQKTPAQVLLRYFIQQDIIVIPKSTNPKRIKENFESQYFVLDNEDMDRLKGLDKGEKGRILVFKDSFKGAERHPEYPFRH